MVKVRPVVLMFEGARYSTDRWSPHHVSESEDWGGAWESALLTSFVPCGTDATAGPGTAL